MYLHIDSWREATGPADLTFSAPPCAAQPFRHLSQPAMCTPPCPAGGGPLSLEAALAAGPAQSEPAPPPIEPAPTDLRAVEEDPVAALAAAVEADKPK